MKGEGGFTTEQTRVEIETIIANLKAAFQEEDEQLKESHDVTNPD